MRCLDTWDPQQRLSLANFYYSSAQDLNRNCDGQTAAARCSCCNDPATIPTQQQSQDVVGLTKHIHQLLLC